MKYFAFAMKIEITLIGLLMMFLHPVISSPPFMSGLAIATVGIYLGLQGYFGESFSGCIFKPKPKVEEKKKGFFG